MRNIFHPFYYFLIAFTNIQKPIRKRMSNLSYLSIHLFYYQFMTREIRNFCISFRIPFIYFICENDIKSIRKKIHKIFSLLSHRFWHVLILERMQKEMGRKMKRITIHLLIYFCIIFSLSESEKRYFF